MPTLILPFQAKAIFCDANRKITEPSADFSKVAYFDKTKKQVINPNMPYISENLVSQPFQKHNLTLEKGLHLHFILPEILRTSFEQSTLSKPKSDEDFKMEFPAIPNKWLVVKNQGKQNEQKYIIESDFFYPEYGEAKANKVTVPIPWAVFNDKEKAVNVPFRYMGRQYDLAQPPKKDNRPASEKKYWHELMEKPLNAEGYGELSFAGFVPNCLNILTFHDSNPQKGDEYVIWGWYDLGEKKKTKAAVDALFSYPKFKGKALEKGILENEWDLELKGDAFESDDANDLFLYSKFKIAGDLNNFAAPTKWSENWDIAVGNTGTEAISAYLKSELNDKNLENLLEAAQFESIDIEDVDAPAKFIQARHEKSFSPTNSGLKYQMNEAVTPNSNEPAAMRKAVKKLMSDAGIKRQLNRLKVVLIRLNKLQANYDGNLHRIQSLQHQLFADWYKYMVANHPPYMQDKDYPAADEILRFLFKKEIKALKSIISQTGLLEVNSQSSEPKLHVLEGLTDTTTTVAAQICQLYHPETSADIQTKKVKTFKSLDTILNKIDGVRSKVKNQSKGELKKQFASLTKEVNGILSDLKKLESSFPKTAKGWELSLKNGLATPIENVNKLHVSLASANIQSPLLPKGILLNAAINILKKSLPEDLEKISVSLNGLIQLDLVTALKQLNALINATLKSKVTQLGKTEKDLVALTKTYEAKTKALKTIKQQLITEQKELEADAGYLKALEAQAVAHKKLIAAKQLKDELDIFAHLQEGETIRKITYSVFTNKTQRFYTPNEPVVMLATEKTEQLTAADINIPVKVKIKNATNTKQLAYVSKGKLASTDPTVLKKQFPVSVVKNWNIQHSTTYQSDWLRMDWAIDYFPIYDASTLEDGNARGYSSSFIYDNFQIQQERPDFSPKKDKEIDFSGYVRSYTGTTMLTSGSEETLAYQIGNFSKDLEANDVRKSSLDKALAKLNTKRVLTQSLGGFNQSLLMRKQTMQLEVFDPIALNDYKPIIDQVRLFVANNRRSAPEPKNYFNPIRGGGMLVKKIRLIDTFGVTNDVFIGQNNKKITRSEVLELPAKSKISGALNDKKAKIAYLPPRFAQAARMNLKWIGSNDAVDYVRPDLNPNPIFGWIVPNFLEKLIQVFDQNGQFLGSLGFVQEGQKLIIELLPKPGDLEFKIQDIHNVHLKNFIQYCQSKKVDANKKFFANFLDKLETSLDYIEPQSHSQHNELSMLVGRPLALVRLSVSLELQGNYAVNQDWSVFKKDLDLVDLEKERETYQFEKVKIPTRIGDYRQLNDGVIGYWYRGFSMDNGERKYIIPEDLDPYTINQADTFYMPLAEKKNQKAGETNPYIIEKTLAQKPQVVTMLMDPRGSLNVSSGVLPVKTIGIPYEYFKEALSQINIHFQVSPIITPFNELQTPLPQYASVDWHWLSVEKLGDERMVDEIPSQPSILQSRFLKVYEAEMDEIIGHIWTKLLTKNWVTDKVSFASVVIPETAVLPDFYADLSNTVRACLPKEAGVAITFADFEKKVEERINDKDLDVESLWEILIQHNWVERKVTYVRNLENAEAFLTPFKEFETEIKAYLPKKAGAVVVQTDLEVKVTQLIKSKTGNIWEILSDKNWIQPLAYSANRVLLNFDNKTRKAFEAEEQFYQPKIIETIFNNHHEGISPASITPQFEQMIIREGWVKVVDS